MLRELARQRPDIGWRWLYRPHRFLRGLQGPVPEPVKRGILLDASPFRHARLFHGLNQRLPQTRFPIQIATFHDLFVMTADYSTPEFRARFTEQARHAAAAADRIVCVSQFTAKQVTSLLNVEASRVTVIPHGVRALAIPALPREKLILHVGAIQRRKNLVRLVRAFEAAPVDWRLVLAGSAGFAAQETFDAIAVSPARDRITVTGYIDADPLANLYGRAALFAFPSLDEGFGMPVLEAMAAGVPVIASGGSAVGEVAGDAALRVDPCSQEQLTEALRKLIADPDLRQSLIAKGIEHASQFTWQKAAAQTFDIYRQFA